MKWSNLSHIDDVEPLAAYDETVLSEVRAVLERHNALERFGVFLVHKHFDLDVDEYVLEETDEEAREQRLVVRRDRDPDRNTIQTMWKFRSDGETMDTECVLRCV